MIVRWIQEEIAYTGSELSSHFALQRFGLAGDSMVAFVGSCDVPLERMADLEDVRRREPIRSPSMLHFIAEHFGAALETAILRQRLLMALIADQLNRGGRDPRVERRGDDLYVSGRKLSVSVAVPSPVSCLIHAGLNVETRGVPVPAVGLRDLGVDAADLAGRVLQDYAEELAGCARARCKVRGVG